MPGGKELFQNGGAAARNSTGTSAGFSCAGRTTFTSTFCWARRFSRMNFVPASSTLALKIMPPLALTVWVALSMGLCLALQVNSGIREGRWAYRMNARHRAGGISRTLRTSITRECLS
jgi:hypothetical protein